MALDYKEYILKNEQNIIRDIKRLVDIRSVGEAATEGAPYGQGVRRVQLEAMKMCSEAGLEVTDCEGRIAFAHLGDKEKFIGIIAHLDVVPEGTGWISDPYCLTEKDGYLIGRGTLDDKTPFVLALYAVKYLMENDVKLSYGIRLIMGLDEEKGMSDLLYYLDNYKEPVFSFTPDSDFPVCHGEKGIYEANLVSKQIPARSRAIKLVSGGVAGNVVPDAAVAELCGDKAELLEAAAKNAAAITLSTGKDGCVAVKAAGKAAHAGHPHGSINANYVLMRFLLDSGVLEGEEKAAAEFICFAMSSLTGEQLSIDGEDGLFEENTVIGGMLSIDDDRFVLNINSRYGTKRPADEIEKNIVAVAAAHGFEVLNVRNSKPFYMSPDTPAVKLMCDIYNEVTGSDEKPYVMSGGTYARFMNNAVSYGIEFPGVTDPEWVGACHMKNEAVSKERAMQACEIFIKTLVKLQDVEL